MKKSQFSEVASSLKFKLLISGAWLRRDLLLPLSHLRGSQLHWIWIERGKTLDVVSGMFGFKSRKYLKFYSVDFRHSAPDCLWR